jgi:hypothetical protein
LPDGSAFARSLNTPGAWTISDHLLASAVELVQETNILLLKAHFKDTPSMEVQRIPRPGPEEEKKPQTIHDVRRALRGG